MLKLGKFCNRSQLLYNKSESFRITAAIVAGHDATDRGENFANTNGRCEFILPHAFSGEHRPQPSAIGLSEGFVSLLIRKTGIFPFQISDYRGLAQIVLAPAAVTSDSRPKPQSGTTSGRY